MIVGNKNDAKPKRKYAKEGYEGKANLFNFVIFKNYDGSVTSKRIARETYNQLFGDTCNRQGSMV